MTLIMYFLLERNPSFLWIAQTALIMDIPIASLPQKNKRPYVPIPEWCPLRKVVLTEIPITIRSMNTIDYIISELFTIGRYAAIRPLKRGLNLVIVGELTSDVKEILVEILI